MRLTGNKGFMAGEIVTLYSEHSVYSFLGDPR